MSRTIRRSLLVPLALVLAAATLAACRAVEESGSGAADLAPWMYFMNPKGMKVPAPAHFLGGVEEMPAGDTAYFTVDLTPGRYALVSEVAPQRHMHTEFTVQP